MYFKKDKVEFYNTDGAIINKKILELSKEDLNINKGDFKHGQKLLNNISFYLAGYSGVLIMTN